MHHRSQHFHHIKVLPLQLPEQRDLHCIRNKGGMEHRVTFEVHARLEAFPIATRRAVLPPNLVDNAIVPSSAEIVVLPCIHRNTHSHHQPYNYMKSFAVSVAWRKQGLQAVPTCHTPFIPKQNQYPDDSQQIQIQHSSGIHTPMPTRLRRNPIFCLLRLGDFYFYSSFSLPVLQARRKL